MTKYVKVMFGTKSGASDFQYQIGKVNYSQNWNPTATNGKDFGGFNYTTEDCIVRWLHRGDTIYDVTIPDGAENITIDGATKIYRTNQIILTNPRPVTDDLALHFYQIAKIPENAYYKALGAVSIMNYPKTAFAIIKDKVSLTNIDTILAEWNDFIYHHGKADRVNSTKLVKIVTQKLNDIKKTNIKIN